jgi:hypothetical protein
MEYNTPVTTPIFDIPANIATHVSLGDVNVAGSIGAKNTGVTVIASAVTGGKNASVDFRNIRVTAGVEGHLLAKGVRKRISTGTNQEGRLNAVELEVGAALGVGATNRVRVERIEPNI